MQQAPCSVSATNSAVTILFARRVNGQDDPWTAMRDIVATLKGGKNRRHNMQRLEQLLVPRNVSEVTYDPDLGCDGFIQPLGLRFRDGFRIALNKRLKPTRLRFTLAHELCHTFFYEYVPELKFVPHEPNELEERVCNFGAAELLMPKSSVMKAAKGEPVSLSSLEMLANLFAVSADAMLIRLRSLQLWSADMSFWTKTNNGEFVAAKHGICRSVAWNWIGSELSKTWETGEPASGKTFIEFIDSTGCRRLRPICYDMQRRHRAVVVLWGTWSMSDSAGRLPLFAECKNKVRA